MIPETEESTEKETIGQKLKRKISHPFKRKYISEGAEKLKRCGGSGERSDGDGEK